MARNNVKYRLDQIEEAVKIAECYSDVFRNLGLGVNGGPCPIRTDDLYLMRELL